MKIKLFTFIKITTFKVPNRYGIDFQSMQCEVMYVHNLNYEDTCLDTEPPKEKQF